MNANAIVKNPEKFFSLANTCNTVQC